jgi:hypothetical protein
VPTLYATVTDLKDVLSGTDGGVGSPAELSTNQLTLALQAASSRVSVYFGTIMDGSNPQAQPPDIFHDLTLDLAMFFAWRTYLKGKAMPVDHPAYLAYQNADAILQDARNGKIRLDPAAAGGVDQEIGLVINRIPRIFTGDNSNTRVDVLTGALEPDTPIGQWTPRGDSVFDAGAVYQG